MSYYYSYGPSLSDQGYSPDDIEYAWRCDCGAEESTPGDLPKGWTVVELDPRGVEVAFRCPRCTATDRLRAALQQIIWLADATEPLSVKAAEIARQALGE